MKNKEASDSLLLMDALLRITVLEKILIDKGILNANELNLLNQEFTKKVARSVLEKANISEDLDKVLDKMYEEK